MIYYLNKIILTFGIILILHLLFQIYIIFFALKLGLTAIVKWRKTNYKNLYPWMNFIVNNNILEILRIVLRILCESLCAIKIYTYLLTM